MSDDATRPVAEGEQLVVITGMSVEPQVWLNR